MFIEGGSNWNGAKTPGLAQGSGILSRAGGIGGEGGDPPPGGSGTNLPGNPGGEGQAPGGAVGGGRSAARYWNATENHLGGPGSAGASGLVILKW